MWNGKNKAVSFSFDDGVSQDRRLVEILNKYGLKATFNLCSAWLGNPEKRDETGRRITNGKVFPGEVRSLYAGHEVAGHALTHPDLTQLPDETVAYQVERDRLILSDLCGVEVVGIRLSLRRGERARGAHFENTDGNKIRKDGGTVAEFRETKRSDFIQAHRIFYEYGKSGFRSPKHF